ncbi:hypothetical protein V3C99_004205 [Haemonchus contortus]
MVKKRARMKAEGRVQTADYRELCEAIREKIKCDYEGYRQKKLREAAERRGVRQGDTISPKLFALTLEALDWTGGIDIDGENLTYLLFADDCVIFAHDALELQAKLVQLQMKSSEIGLEINLSKTKWMHNQFSPTATVKINGKPSKKWKALSISDTSSISQKAAAESTAGAGRQLGLASTKFQRYY